MIQHWTKQVDPQCYAHFFKCFVNDIATNSAQFNFNEQEDSGADRSYYYFPCFINSEL